MKVLLVNDDGIHSPGLAAVREALAKDHELWMSAPDREKSGASHSISFAEAVRTRNVDDKTLMVQGSPADCVLAAFHVFSPETPDIVVSGINIGANLGADIVYSGTAGAARQAVFLGVPGVAISLDTFSPPLYLNTAAKFIAENLREIASLWHESGDKAHFINVNVPNVERFEGNVVIAPPAKLAFKNTMVSFSSPRGESYSFYQGSERLGMAETVTTDIDVVADGNIAVSPVRVYPEMSETKTVYAAHRFAVDGDGA